MPAIVTDDGVTLHAEETGPGEPLLFVHEFAGDHRSWEPQLRFFSATYRCVTYAARGYPPSDVPTDPGAYSQERAVADAIAVLDGLKIRRAHVVGLSMGGFTADAQANHPHRRPGRPAAHRPHRQPGRTRRLQPRRGQLPRQRRPRLVAPARSQVPFGLHYRHELTRPPAGASASSVPPASMPYKAGLTGTQARIVRHDSIPGTQQHHELGARLRDAR